ncbi:hypothetical protein VTL71DRAFT_16140 [Oculimacula yallundae]|uniref:Conidiation-specific protein 13 n=1 Tax=Oculimacula yallundae TaxID=86028 RepID=A0ABR4CEU6_9HELO
MVSTSSLKVASLASILFCTSALTQRLDKPTLWGAGMSPLIDQGLWKYLVPTPSTVTQWAAGSIPQRCADVANTEGPKLNPADFEVFNVRYSDCLNPWGPWSFCRHKNAPISQASMIDLFGRIPVHERQWIQHVVAVPGANSAYMGSAIVVFRGTVSVPSVFQHEIGHAVDFYKNGFQTSARSEWLNAIAQDTCVPDSYSNSNAIEDFAQIGVVSLFSVVNPGGLDPAFAHTWHCFLQQFNTYNSFQSDAMTPGGVCTRRWADSPIISTKAAKTVSGAPLQKPGNVLGMPGVFAIPFESRADTVFDKLITNDTEAEAEAAVARQDVWAEEANAARKAKRAQRSEKIRFPLEEQSITGHSFMLSTIALFISQSVSLGAY